MSQSTKQLPVHWQPNPTIAQKQVNTRVTSELQTINQQYDVSNAHHHIDDHTFMRLEQHIIHLNELINHGWWVYQLDCTSKTHAQETHHSCQHTQTMTNIVSSSQSTQKVKVFIIIWSCLSSSLDHVCIDCDLCSPHYLNIYTRATHLVFINSHHAALTLMSLNNAHFHQRHLVIVAFIDVTCHFRS